MKSATIFLAAVTLFTLFLESSTAPAFTSSVAVANADVTINIQEILQKSAFIKDLIVKAALAKVTDRLETLISNIGNKIKAINGLGAKVKVDKAEKQLINQAIDNSEAALVRAKDVVAADLVKAKGDAKNTLSAVGVWLDNLHGLCVYIHKVIRAEMASGSVIALKKISVVTSMTIAEAKEDYAEINKVLIGKSKVELNKEMKINFVNADVIDAGLKRILSGESSTPVA